jgi:cyclophilin family peptidyl-prolyl cis-trans isomerase
LSKNSGSSCDRNEPAICCLRSETTALCPRLGITCPNPGGESRSFLSLAGQRNLKRRPHFVEESTLHCFVIPTMIRGIRARDEFGGSTSPTSRIRRKLLIIHYPAYARRLRLMRTTHSSHRILGGRSVCVVNIALRSLCLLVAAAGCNSKSDESPTLSLNSGSDQSEQTIRHPEKPKFNPNPEVEVKTSAGTFVLKLNAQKAPLTVHNFLHYVNRGSYDGTLFHEIYPDIALGGGFDEKLVQRPTEMAIRNEAHNGLKNTRGTVAMARQPDGIDSATNQFFINLTDNSPLDYVGPEPKDYGYCVFGEIVSGMEVVDRLAKVEVHRNEKFASAPVEPIVIESMKVKN